MARGDCPRAAAAVFAALLLAACAAPEPEDAPASVAAAFQCGDQRVEARFAGDTLKLGIGFRGYTLSRVRAASGARYEGGEGASRVIFRDRGTRALLEIGDRAYPECRRLAAEPAAPLHGPEWVVEDIAGGGVIDHSRTTLLFAADGTLAGLAGCNRYSTRYDAQGWSLSVGAIAATRKACPPALMDQEARFLDLLAAVQRFAIADDGALVLTAAGGETITARR